jgi:hypothetical protein
MLQKYHDDADPTIAVQLVNVSSVLCHMYMQNFTP